MKRKSLAMNLIQVRSMIPKVKQRSNLLEVFFDTSESFTLIFEQSLGVNPSLILGVNF